MNISNLSKQNQEKLSLKITSIFLILGLIGILNHAMWRDELNVWLITRDSLSISDLFNNIHYEGHPPLWYLCLSFLNIFTNNPLIMQIFHLGLATTTTYLVLRFAPFTNLQKILFIFGYLPFYEYLLVSRNYAIGLLCIILFCVLYETRKLTYLWLSLVLFFMANCNAYSLFISLALGLTLFIEYLFGQTINPELKIKATKGNFLSGSIIYLTGIFISFYFLIPPQDSLLAGGLTQWTLNFDWVQLGRALGRIWNSYLAVITFSDSDNIESICFGIISLILIIFTSLIFRKKPIILFLYLAGTLAILTFTYIKFLGGTRHYGHLYILLIASFWLSSYYDQSDFITQPFTKIFHKINFSETITKFIDRQAKTYLILLLLLQLAAGMVAFSRDLIVPYSAGKETAKYIKTEQLDQMYMVGSRDVVMATLCGYLERKIYYPEIQKMGSFVLFTKFRQEVSDEQILPQVKQILQSKQTPEILLILNHEITINDPQLKMKFIHSFNNTFMSDEKYYLYKVKLG